MLRSFAVRPPELVRPLASGATDLTTTHEGETVDADRDDHPLGVQGLERVCHHPLLASTHETRAERGTRQHGQRRRDGRHQRESAPTGEAAHRFELSLCRPRRAPPESPRPSWRDGVGGADDRHPPRRSTGRPRCPVSARAPASDTIRSRSPITTQVGARTSPSRLDSPEIVLEAALLGRECAQHGGPQQGPARGSQVGVGEAVARRDRARDTGPSASASPSPVSDAELTSGPSAGSASRRSKVCSDARLAAGAASTSAAARSGCRAASQTAIAQPRL